MTNKCSLEDKKIPIIKKWLGRKGLQFVQTLTKAEQEACKAIEGLFETLS